jgi:UDP-glucose 4-epimerase
MTRILVTGANGFVGRALVDELLKSGYPVTAAVRDTTAIPPWPDTIRVVTVGDIHGATDWHEALEGVERIVHLAGIAHHPIDDDTATAARYGAVNVDATTALATVAARAGAARLLFLSSVKVNGEATMARPFTEGDAPAPRDIYGRSKWQAEQSLARIAGATGLACTVIRSPLVYGPGVRGNFASLLRLCDTPLPLPLAAIHNRRSLIARANLVSAILAGLTHPAAANETFLARDGEDLSTTDLVRRLRRALGRPPRLVPLPAVLLAGAARLSGRADLADRLLGSLTVDDSKIRALLNWQPPIGPDQALAETAAAYRRSGHR